MSWTLPPQRTEPRTARVALGLAIRQLRREQGLTQVQLEERAGLDQTIISRLERGIDIHLRTARLMTVLDALGVDRIVLRSRYDDATLAGFMRRLLHVDDEQ